MQIRERLSKHKGVPAEEAVEDFRLACVSRSIDDREIILKAQSKVFFQISGAGHEALLLGLARHLDPAKDWFFPYYRDRALMVGLGVTPADILKEAVGAADDPASGARQMPSHWGYKDQNVVTQSSATGSQCIPAVGCAEAGRYIWSQESLKGRIPAAPDEVTYVSLGEGACSEGEFWEALSSACTLKLPVLFVVADNGYAISVRSSDQAPAPVSELVRGFKGLSITKLDGCDYFEVRRKAAKIIPKMREGEGPALLHATVTRPYSHSLSDDQKKYRTAEDLEQEKQGDPLLILERELVSSGILTAEEAEQIRSDAKALVAEAAKEALAAPRPDPATVLHHVTAPPAPITEGDPGGSGDPIVMGDAINRTLHDEMARDERIRVFGEDVADAYEDVLDNVKGKGGVFGITLGLQRKFGIDRCFNSPLAEANIVGRAVGQATRGLRPCAEIQFFDYIWPAMQQIKTEAATTRWRSNGAFSAPMVIRVASGGYLQGGAIWHSQINESIFAHVPGLQVVFPSRSRDAVGLLRTALRHSEDPVLFIEHKKLYREMYLRDPYPDPDYVVPFGKGSYVARGDDMTVVTYGATLQKSVLAAKQLEADGLTVEIIDLRSILPWDKEMVAESVAKTGRLLVVHEDILTAGFGGEIAAWVAEHCFWDLDAPVMRVGAKDCHVAYEPTLENAILPQVDDVVAALRSLASQ
ncbi:MAG TPA: dehydrogenase E1 component subunit alpha/beta [Actinomycetota bacterium]|nr:dehydrogenase E1 component subunit alpha/beta [Actinomycetota bacterium]